MPSCGLCIEVVGRYLLLQTIHIKWRIQHANTSRLKAKRRGEGEKEGEKEGKLEGGREGPDGRREGERKGE